MATRVVARPRPDIEGCVLHRDPSMQFVCFIEPRSKKEFYLAEGQGQSGLQPIFNGGPISVDCLNDGTVATVYVGHKGVVEKIEVTYLREKKSMNMIYREGFVVFSAFKFNTSMLVFEHNDTPTQHLAAQTISSKCAGIRKVSSDAGKGFWTAVGLAYLEHLALDVTGDQEFEYFAGLLKKAGVNEGEGLMRYLAEMRNCKKMRQNGQYTDGRDHFQGEEIDVWHNNQDFQMEMVKAIKALTIKYAQEHPEHEMQNYLENGLSGFETEIKYTTDTSEAAIAFAACALPIKLVIYSLDPTQLRQGYECDRTHPNWTYIRLLRQYDSYYILYTANWLAVEGYNVNFCVREKPGAFSMGTVHSLYYLPKDDKVQLLGTATKEEYQSKLASLSKQTESIAAIESLITTVFETIKAHPIPNGNFFDDAMLAQTYQLKAEYSKALSKTHRLPQEDTQREQQQLRQLSDSQVLDDLTVMKRCDKCQDRVGIAMLECGHYLCTECFMILFNEVYTSKGYIVEPSGEPISDLVCPLTSCYNQSHISSQTVQMVLGDQFDAYQQQGERAKGQMKCTKCAKVYSSISFLQYVYCGCKICMHCQVELMKLNYGMCLCGNAFNPNSLNAVYALTEVCVSCQLSLPLMTRFTPVRCSEHILCVKCLEMACKQPEPRCPSDYRIFAPYEIEMAKKFFVRPCDLYCGQFFKSSFDSSDSSGALDLPCGCHYCKRCAVQDVMSGKPIQNCFACRKPFPTANVEMWTKMLKESEFMNYTLRTVKQNAMNQYVAQPCSICMSRIGQSQMFLLKCGHVFHKDCVSDLGANFISAVVKAEMTCPYLGCGKPIDANDLQRAMVPKDFLRYCEKLMEAKNKMIQCPNCRLQHVSEGIEFGPRAHVACQGCGYNFCAMCTQQWIEPHDFERCKFEDLKVQILVLEATVGQGVGNEIAQCPGCKTPFLKDDHCDHINCPCSVEWCFKCSCYRLPTTAHHNMWHRPKCPYYAVVPNDNEPMKQNCPKCVKKGSRCDPPKDLKVPCRFDFDEYNIDD